MDDIRYYIGDEEDLKGLSFFEVELMTYTFKWEAEEAFEEYIDDAYGTIFVGDLEYTASDVIKNCDPIAWRCMMADGITEVDMGKYDDTGDED